MKNVLIIQSSITGENSASNALAQHFEKVFKAKHPDAVVTTLDVGANPVPQLTSSVLGAFFTPADAQTEAQQAVDAESQRYIQLLKDADLVVVAYGLYNLTVPPTLLSFIGQIARAGHTFKYTETGPVGLLAKQELLLLGAYGGVYEGPTAGYDFAGPYLQGILGFLGMTKQSIVKAQGLAMAGGPEGVAAILEKAKEEVDRFVG